jgi:hypothetical protein
VLGALTVVKRVSALCCLVLTGCLLNPQGEDPGLEKNGAATPNADLPQLFPGEEPAVDNSESDEAISIGPGAGAPPVAMSPASPVPGSVAEPSLPVANPEAPSDPAGPVLTPTSPPEPEQILEPSPDLAAGGAAAGSAGAGGGAIVEDDPRGIDFDGGTLNYASPTDADDTDSDTAPGPDAGASRADAAAYGDAGDVSP